MKNPMLLVDNYKLDHVFMYPEGMTKLYSNFTPRTSRIKDIYSVVVFGIHNFIKDYLIKAFDEHFFKRNLRRKKKATKGKIILSPKRKYSLQELLSQCNPKAPEPADLAVWNAAKPVGQEIC